jgi:hypothetical protein
VSPLRNGDLSKSFPRSQLGRQLIESAFGVICIPHGRHGLPSLPGDGCRGHIVCAQATDSRGNVGDLPLRPWCDKLGPVTVVFDAELWLWDARRADTWVFVSLPASQSEEIRDLAGGLRRGFGSVRVRVTIGSSTWRTSIFPDSQAGYVLPVKRPVRVAEALDVGDVATVTVELLDFT